DGVEPPEERNLVAQAMRPVIGGLAHRHRGAGLEPDRPTGDGREDAARDDLMDRKDRDRNRRAEHEAGQEPVEEVIAEIDGDLLAEDLLAMKREEPLD